MTRRTLLQSLLAGLAACVVPWRGKAATPKPPSIWKNQTRPFFDPEVLRRAMVLTDFRPPDYIFVDSVRGSDFNDGSHDAPFATFSRGLRAHEANPRPVFTAHGDGKNRHYLLNPTFRGQPWPYTPRLEA